MQKISKENKKRFEEQHYTYIRKERRSLRRMYKKERQEKDKQTTYIEQIEAQKSAVKSQILNHL